MSDEGASPAEQIVEATRRNNVDLLQQVFDAITNPEERAKVINDARDPVGNSPLHLGALNGSFEALDLILDQEGVEVDPVDLLEGETPLHSVVRYSKEEPEHGAFMAEVLVDAGCDPRLKNKRKQKPVELCDFDNHQLIHVLRAAEYAVMAPATNQSEEADGDGKDEGSASDSE